MSPRLNLPQAALAAGALALAGLAAWLWLAVREGPARNAGATRFLLLLPLRLEPAPAEAAWLRQGLPELLRAELEQHPSFEVVSRGALAAGLRTRGLGEEATLPRQAALALARSLGAEWLLSGTLSITGDRFAVRLEISSVAGRRQDGAVSASGRYPAEVLGGVHELAGDTLRQLERAEGPGQAPRPAWGRAPLATRSLAASRAYVEALDWFHGRAAADAAEQRLDEALRLDPAFAQAYVKKAEIERWRVSMGYGGPEPGPTVQAALAHLESLSDQERLLVRGLDALVLRRQPEEALRHWDTLLQFHPVFAQRAGVPTLVLETFNNLGQWDRTLEIGALHADSPHLTPQDRALLHCHLAAAHRRRGDLQQAIEQTREALRLWPSGGGPRFLSQRTTLGRLLLESGRSEEGLAELHAVVAAADEAPNMTDAAWGLYMGARDDEALALVERALRNDPGYGNAYHLRGWLLLKRGQWQAAAQSLETAFERTAPGFGSPHHGLFAGDVGALYYSGVARQKAGREAAAAATFRRVMELCRSSLAAPETAALARWQAGNYLARAAARLGQAVPGPGRLAGDEATDHVQSARLHAVQGRTDEALREIAAGLAAGFGERQHIRDDPDFEALRGRREFVALVGR